jgi:heme oxygenase
MATTGTLTLMETLKQAVKESHGRMEAIPFFQALIGDQLPLASYVGQLRALAVIHGALEHELALVPADGAVRLLAERPLRLVHLRMDLSGFEPMFIPDIKPALPHALGIADQIRRYRVERPADLLGVMYVLEGSSLGNMTLLPRVLRNFGARTSGTAHYYQGYGPGTAQHWAAFRAAMNAFPVDADGRSHIVQAALDLFDRMAGLYAALYPIQAADSVFSATMLNPEAGDHPVPQDLRAMQAAVAAAVKCHDEFPYFNERFKERGREFAKSDAAWLATLVDLPESEVIGQVEWLGRVLGNRGIPRLTLERQLILLQEELAAAWPERAQDFRILREAAGTLARERFHLLPEGRFLDLVRAFQLATDGEQGGSYKGTGALIVSAVCDEAAGIPRAVDSLRPWLCEPGRFSPAWIAAVASTIEQAREALAPRQ